MTLRPNDSAADFFESTTMRNGLLLVMALGWMVGCEPPPKKAPVDSAPGPAPAANAPAVSPSTPTPPAGVPVPSDSGASAAVPAAADGIPPELIQQVNDLVRLTKEYNAIAATIKTRDDYIKNLDALSALDQQLEPYVIGLEVDQAKLSPAARKEFDQKYYEGLAKPVVEEKRAHTRRFLTLVQ
jgi:hypothetical protein